MGFTASRSSSLRGLLNPPDAADGVDVATALPGIEVLRPGEPPRCTRALTGDARLV